MVMAGWMMMLSPVAMMIAPLRTARQAAPLPRPESEQAFSDWLKGALQDAPGSRVYPEVFAEAQECVVRWRRRYHGNARLWKQLFKSDKVIKELVEAAPVIAMARALVTSAKLPPGERFTTSWDDATELFTHLFTNFVNLQATTCKRSDSQILS